MSGDVNTSLGNTLIQLCLLKCCTSSIEGGVDILVEGDDAVVFCDSAVLRRLGELVMEQGKHLGMVYKVSHALCLEEVDYCSTRIIETPGGKWRSVRNIKRALATDLYTARPVKGEEAAAEKARLVGVCQAMVYRGLPVFHAWATRLLSFTQPHKRGKPLDEWYDRRLWLLTKERIGALVKDIGVVNRAKDYSGKGINFLDPVEVDSQTRSSFYLAYGILPSEQLALEASLLSDLGPHPPAIAAGELDQLFSQLG
jgi:hypothetical protein